MESRKDRRAAVGAEVLADRAANRDRKVELAAMSSEERRQTRNEDKEEKVSRKKARIAAIRKMPPADKKAAKRHDRLYRRIKRRPSRLVICIAVLCLLLFGVYQITPIVGGLMEMMSLQTTDSPAGERARANALMVAEAISDEGIVLLKNEGGTLPLQDMRINVFGTASIGIRYGGGGAGASSELGAIDLYQSLTLAGIQYNESLYEATFPHVPASGSNGLIGVLQGILFGKRVDEPSPDYLTDGIVAEAKAYSPNAMIVLSTRSIEGTDSTLEELRLSENQRKLIDIVTGNFENVIVVINSGTAMELGFLEEYPSIKAALWIGTPGPIGGISLAKILTGKVNPSGRLVDTYAYDVSSSPASVNFGDFPYSNIKNRAFLNYEEGVHNKTWGRQNSTGMISSCR